MSVAVFRVGERKWGSIIFPIRHKLQLISEPLVKLLKAIAEIGDFHAEIGNVHKIIN
jgi:hypothetical protein